MNSSSGAFSGTPPAGAASHTVTVTVTDKTGTSVSRDLTLNVTTGTYSVTPNSASLTQGVKQTLQFIITQGGLPVPTGTSVTITANADIPALPTLATTTDASGKITLSDLIVSASMNQTIAITKVGGENVTLTIPVTVTAGTVHSIELDASTTTPSVDEQSVITATVKNSAGIGLSGKSVVFTWNLTGGTPKTGSTVTTDAYGKASYTLSGNGGRRSVTVTGTVDGKSDDVPVQFGNALPNGIVAMHPGTTNLGGAKSWCSDQGGRLPLIDGDTIRSTAIADDTPIEGFGTTSDPWPTDLPGDKYWTGTARTNGTPYIVLNFEGGVSTYYGPISSDPYHVVCFP